MRNTTILIALTMLTTGLAGCTGDPDGGGNDEFAWSEWSYYVLWQSTAVTMHE